MSHRIACFTLFDITQTGVLNRAKPSTDDILKDWLYKRSTQANFDTIIQVISLRTQPDIIVSPKKIEIRFDKFSNFGAQYQQVKDEVHPCWTFDFEVHYPSVFDDEITELGYLYKDCDGIPMIKTGTEYDKLSTMLDTTPELKNIHFIKY
jgi:hypothetical protein